MRPLGGGYRKPRPSEDSLLSGSVAFSQEEDYDAYKRFRYMNPDPDLSRPEALDRIRMAETVEADFLARPDSRDSRITLRKREAALRSLDKAIVYPRGFSQKEALTTRNEALYAMLKRNRMCVVPDETIRSVDSLPHFEFLESVRAGLHEELQREKRIRFDNSKRIQRISIGTIMNESEVGGSSAALKLKEFNIRLNDYAIKRIKMNPTFKKIVSQPGFQSPSTKITADMLIRKRANIRNNRDEEDSLGGRFFKKLIDRRYEVLQKSQASTKDLSSPKLKQFERDHAEQRKRLELSIIKGNVRNLET